MASALQGVGSALQGAGKTLADLWDDLSWWDNDEEAVETTTGPATTGEDSHTLSTDGTTTGTDTTTDTTTLSTVPVYPGVGASETDKYDFYHAIIGLMGHGGDLGSEPGSYNLVGIRGLEPDRLAELVLSDLQGTYDDMFVVIGITPEGAKVLKEYPGTTDPGKHAEMAAPFNAMGENWKLQPGAYEYQHNGVRSAAVGGGESFVMTGAQTKEGVDLQVDGNANDVWNDTEDSTRTETGNPNFLIHRGGKDEEAGVGAWSAGCQVIAGQNEAGQLNMDEAAGYLKQNDGAFNYILLDGAALKDKLGASPSA